MTTHPPLWPVGTRVRVTAGWWLVRGMPAEATIAAHLVDERFPYAITVGDGREWAMSARELAQCA